MLNQGHAWERIAVEVGRIAPDCRDRWVKVLEPKTNPNLRAGSWDETEERRLTELVDKYKKNWEMVGKELGTRSGSQCRDK